MDLSESQLIALLGALFPVALLIAYPAMLTAVAWLRAEKKLGKSLRAALLDFDRHRRS